MCQMKVKLDHGPADHPCGQGAVERYLGWLHDVSAESWKQWPERWDYRTTPDPPLPANPTPFELLFGRKPRTHLDYVSPPRKAITVEQHGGIAAT